MSNPLSGEGLRPAPGPPSEAPPPGPGPDLSPMMSHLHGASDQTQVRYEKLKDQSQRTGVARRELDALLKLGDMVGEEDLVRAGAGMVAGGYPTAGVAGLLASAPEEGQALQAWVQAQDQGLRQREAMLAFSLKLARHRMGSAGMKVLMGHSVEAAEAGPEQGMGGPLAGPEPQDQGAPLLGSSPMNEEPPNAG